MWPLELTAMPLTSPRYMLSGSFSGSGTESKLMAGGVCCCARTGRQIDPKRLAASNATDELRIDFLLCVPRYLSGQRIKDRSSFAPGERRQSRAAIQNAKRSRRLRRSETMRL